MNESKQMMKGNCAKYFCLQLSFIGWMILSMIPAVLIEEIVALLNAPVIVQSLVAVIVYLFMVPVTAYQYSTFAGFYEILAGHLIKETEPAPIEPEEIPVPSPSGSVHQEEHPETSVKEPEDNSQVAETEDGLSTAEGIRDKEEASDEPVKPEKMESKSVDVTAVMESSSEGDGAEASKNNDGNDDNDNSFIPKEMK